MMDGKNRQMVVQFKYVTEAFSLYSDITRCLLSTPRSCTDHDSEENSTRTLFKCRVCSSIVPEPCSGAGYVFLLHIYSEPCYIYLHTRVMHAYSGEGSAPLCIH